VATGNCYEQGPSEARRSIRRTHFLLSTFYFLLAAMCEIWLAALDDFRNWLGLGLGGPRKEMKIVVWAEWRRER
jgi:hypothetical protein